MNTRLRKIKKEKELLKRYHRIARELDELKACAESSLQSDYLNGVHVQRKKIKKGEQVREILGKEINVEDWCENR